MQKYNKNKERAHSSEKKTSVQTNNNHMLTQSHINTNHINKITNANKYNVNINCIDTKNDYVKKFF